MKTILNKLLSLTLVLTLATTALAAPDDKKDKKGKATIKNYQLAIAGLDAPGAAAKAQASLAKIKGVLKVMVDAKGGLAFVTFKQSGKAALTKKVAAAALKGTGLKLTRFAEAVPSFKYEVIIQGMDDKAAEAKARKTLEGIKGVKVVSIDRKTRTALISMANTMSPKQAQGLAATLNRAGFAVGGIRPARVKPPKKG